MNMINLQEKLDQIKEYFQHHVIADVNDHQVLLTKSKGEFIWHKHEEEDEFFLILKGRFLIKFRDRDLWLNEGECAVVPRGVEHKTIAPEEAHMLKFEPKTIVNTGNVRNERTHLNNPRI